MITSAKAPQRFRIKANETYAEARTRWVASWDAYRDACAMNTCETFRASPQRNFMRAFYGVQMHFVTEVLNGKHDHA